MRAWPAAVVLNVLLLAAGMAGASAWRRAHPPLSDAAAQAVLGWGGPEREWRDLHAVVRAVVPDLGVIVLTHEDIPGYMPGMTMGFRLAVTSLPAGLAVGDTVRFTLQGAPPQVAVTAIDKTR